MNLTRRILKLEQRMNALESEFAAELKALKSNNGWSAWAQKIIIALLTLLLAVLGYKEAASIFGA